MVWNDTHKIIFIHIPKTGGTSIEKAFNALNSENGFRIENGKAVHHFTYLDYKTNMNDKFNEYFKFTIVRNPYEKVISEYFWLKNIARIDIDNFQNKTFDEYLDYCDFIIKNNLYNRTIFHDHFMRQHTFIFKNDKLMIDKILRFENFEYIKNFMESNYKINISHENKNNYNFILSDSQRNKIYKIYQKDFKLLKYPK